eukprot:gb/GECG01016533.1/.p1 GENE.gb/GECG01016533.1/~~gb/GECG01016533.1/.p1  ORF type:complete len:307 (+),score=52.48 gb/GECG01016533.1/:1-921(+)
MAETSGTTSGKGLQMQISLQESPGNNERPYDLYDVTVTTEDGKSWTIQKRYSEFHELKLELDQIVPHLSDLFPPKRLIGNRTPENIRDRVQMIPQYFNEAINHASEHILENAQFQEFFQLGGTGENNTEHTTATSEEPTRNEVAEAGAQSTFPKPVSDAENNDYGQAPVTTPVGTFVATSSTLIDEEIGESGTSEAEQHAKPVANDVISSEEHTRMHEQENIAAFQNTQKTEDRVHFAEVSETESSANDCATDPVVATESSPTNDTQGNDAVPKGTEDKSSGSAANTKKSNKSRGGKNKKKRRKNK